MTDYSGPYPVPMTATPLDHAGLAGYFESGHFAATGRPAGSRELLATALGIIGVENADGRAIIQYNWGNISADLTRYQGPFWFQPRPQPNQPIAFRAYANHVEGAKAWWRLMYRAFPDVLRRAAAGDSVGMIRTLYADRYVVGGSETGYASNAARLSQRYRSERLFSGFRRSDSAAAILAAVGVGALASLWVSYA